MATRPLAPDETRTKRYSDLSRGAKQRVDLERREALKKAQADVDAGDSFGRKADDVLAKVLSASPLNARANSDIADINVRAGERARKRSDALSKAQEEANYEDIRRESPTGLGGKYFYDDVPGKAYKKGGRVTGYRGYGKAKKV